MSGRDVLLKTLVLCHPAEGKHIANAGCKRWLQRLRGSIRRSSRVNNMHSSIERQRTTQATYQKQTTPDQAPKQTWITKAFHQQLTSVRNPTTETTPVWLTRRLPKKPIDKRKNMKHEQKKGSPRAVYLLSQTHFRTKR